MTMIKAFFHEPTSTLTYVVWDSHTRDAVVIDPVLDYDPLGSKTATTAIDEVTKFLRAEDLSVRHILETHAHADHLSGSQLLKHRFDAPVGIGENITVVQATFKPVFGLGADFPTDGRQFDRLLVDGETLEAGSLSIGVTHTPGHTPACVTYRIGDAVFTGDALFMDDYGTGRCDFPRGSAASLYESVHDTLYALPDATRVFVGHDYQPDGRPLRYETTIGASKAQNPQLREVTTKDEFIRFRQARDATLAAPKLLYQSVQVNIDGGRLPPADTHGIRHLRLPVNLGQPTDEIGQPVSDPT